MEKLTRAALLIVLVFTVFASEKSIGQDKSSQFLMIQEQKTSSGEIREKMNLLWQENSFWSRNLMLCIIDSVPGKDQALWRLTKNQDDICELLKPFFGDEQKAVLAELFYSYMNFEIEVIKASMTDSVLAKEALSQWHKSTNEIASFLHKQNPKWMLKDLKEVMNTQVEMTYQAIRQRVIRDFDLEVIAFDKMIKNGNKVSNMFSQGIIYQYPQKFSDLVPRTAALK